MIKWLTGLVFGKTFVPHDPPLEEYQKHVKANEERKAAEETKAKKSTAKKKAKVDLDSMKKDELLAHAKKNGIKANASMKKADILAAINNG